MPDHPRPAAPGSVTAAQPTHEQPEQPVSATDDVALQWAADRLNCPAGELQESRGSCGSLLARRDCAVLGAQRLYIAAEGTAYWVPSSFPSVERVEAELAQSPEFARRNRAGHVTVRHLTGSTTGPVSPNPHQ